MNLRIAPFRKQIILLSIIGYCNCAWSQQRITLDEMRNRYVEYVQKKVNPAANKENDEVVESHYYLYNRKDKRYSNPREHDSKDYPFMLTSKLRTEEYPEKRHFWSLIDYERVNHRTFHSHKRPLERRRLRYKDKSFIRYLALDSIDGVSPELWPKSFRKRYYSRKHKFHYAKAVSDTLFLLSDVRNMLGYMVSPTFWDVEIRHGRVVNPDHLGERCEEQMGNLMYLGPLPKLDGSTTTQQRINQHLTALADSINKGIKAADPPKEKQRFDLLIVHLPDSRADVELLWTDGKAEPTFTQMREALRQLPPKFFVHYWATDGQPLPGSYLQGTYYKNGTWGFTMDSFLSSFVGQR